LNQESLFIFASVSAIVSFVLCFFLTKWLIGFLIRKNMTVLDYHKVDRPSIPRPGGPAILAGIIIGEAILFAGSGSYAILALIFCTLISGLIGMVDDLKTLGGIAKPALLLVGGVPILAIQYFVPKANVYNSEFYLPLFHSPAHIPLIYPLLVLISIPVVTNTINTIDVLNGVVSGFILIACIPVTLDIFLRVLDNKSDPIVLLAMVPILATTGAFFLFHRYPSKIFPGDSGSIALGAAYGTMAIIGGAELVAVVAILPAILNSFFFLSTMKRLVEHRQIKNQPTALLPDGKVISTDDPKAPVTLMRMLVARSALGEDEIAKDILKLSLYCALLAGITAILTWTTLAI
jgi:UDP-N-acetylmuramyl pentapeptide phosphotransferase/UDP-N-acetylglucosamine-1-phosphate transferase